MVKSDGRLGDCNKLHISHFPTQNDKNLSDNNQTKKGKNLFARREKPTFAQGASVDEEFRQPDLLVMSDVL
jgi:hypothetical protein